MAVTPKPKTHRTTLRWEAADFRWLKATAAKSGCSMAEYQRNIILNAKNQTQEEVIDVENIVENALEQMSEGLTKSHNLLTGRLKAMAETNNDNNEYLKAIVAAVYSKDSSNPAKTEDDYVAELEAEEQAEGVK